MNPEVTIIGRPSVDSSNLLFIANKILGRSLSKSVDAKRSTIKSPGVLICYLLEMANNNSTPSLKNAGSLLRHLSYSFLIRSGSLTIFDLLSQSSVDVFSVECEDGANLSYASGNLEEWKVAIINSCSDSSTLELRLLFDKILLLFEAEGLSDIFSEYRKITLPDKTFRIEQK